MHASLHELLTLRDEVVADSAVSTHVRDCAKCRGELERLRGVTTQLRQLPSQMAAPDRWQAIQTALAEGGSLLSDAQTKKRPGWLWPMGVAATVLMTVTLLTWRSERNAEDNDPAQAGEQTVSAEHRSLIAESRELEKVLAALPEERAVVRASTALTLADLQDRIQWVDYRLEHGDEAGLHPDQSQLLLRERVDLLNSLVAVRYAQVRTAF